MVEGWLEESFRDSKLSLLEEFLKSTQKLAYKLTC